MKNANILISLIIGFVLLYSCNSNNNNDNTEQIIKDTVSSVVIDTTKDDTNIVIQNIGDTNLMSVNFNENRILYYATKKEIISFTTRTRIIDTIIKKDNIIDFYYDENYNFIYYAVKQDKEIYFYSIDPNEDNVKEYPILNIDSVFNNIKKEESKSFSNIKILSSGDGGDVIEIVFFYSTDYSEGPYSPYVHMIIDNITESVYELDVENKDLLETKAYNEINIKDINISEEQTKLLKQIDYEQGKGLVLNNKIILVPDTTFVDTQRDRIKEFNQFYVMSPDLTKCLWLVETDWLEGPMYSYFLINLDGSGYKKIFLFDNFMWLDSNKLLTKSWDGLYLFNESNDKIVISKDIQRFMTQSGKIINIY